MVKDSDINTNGQLRRRDLIVSTILWLFSLVILVDSVRMTFYIELPGVETKVWLVSPGFMPLIFSIGLLLMFSAIIFISLKEADLKGHFTRSAMLGVITKPDNVTKMMQVALLCIFVFVLIGRIHFGIASALYLFFAMVLAKAAKLYQIALISILFAGLVTFLFGTLMRIPLP